MSAINVVKQRDRVVLATDGGAYKMDSGVLFGFPAKQATVPSWPGVVATRGAVLCTPVFAHLLSFRFDSFDAMVAGIEDAIADIHARVKATCGNEGADEPLVIATNATRASLAGLIL
jgi:hypothetical protein